MRFFALIVISVFLFSFGNHFEGEYYDAAYPGGQDALDKYLRDSIKYPGNDRMNGVEGIVYVDFDISERGKVCNGISTLSIGGSGTLEAEALRLVNVMPDWSPARSDGKKIESRRYVEVRFELPDSLVKLAPASEDTTIFSFCEKMPVFPGDMNSMHFYLQKNIKYPQMEKEQGKDGLVYVSYVVERNGKITYAKIVKGVPGAPGLAKESLRVVESFPRHRPGTQNGMAVRMRLTVPIRFNLQ